MKRYKIYFILFLALAFVTQSQLASAQTVSTIENPDWIVDSHWTINAPVAAGNTVQDVILAHNSAIDFTLGIKDSVVISSGITLTTSEEIKIFSGGQLHIWGALMLTNESIKVLPAGMVHIHDGGLLIGMADVELKELSGEFIIDAGGSMHWTGDWKNNGGSGTTMTVDGTITIGGGLDNKIDIVGDGSITVYGTLNNFPNASIFGCTLTGDGCCLGLVPCVLESTDDPLPVKLLFYDAYQSADKVVIEWNIGLETSNGYFIVDRSVDAKNWLQIAEVPGTGNRPGETSYKIFDENPVAGLAYYRLVEKNIEGVTSYLGIDAIMFKTSKTHFNIYPNPARGAVVISLGAFDNAEISILDYTGRRVGGSDVKYHEFVYDISSFPAGLYFVELRSGDIMQTRKLIVN